MIDDRDTNRRQSALVLIGIALVTLAIGFGSWYGLRAAAANAAPRNSDTAATASIVSPTTLVNGRLPNSSGIEKGETIISKSFYARPPPLFDAVAAFGVTASASGLSGSSTVSLPRASSAVSVVAKDVLPAGWAGIGASLDRMWESNAASAWNVRSTPLTPPNWRISGVVQRGAQTQILVQFDGEPDTRFFKVGDVLPGGGKLAWVKPNVIGVSFPKKKPLAVPLVEDPFQPASSAGSTAAPAKARP